MLTHARLLELVVYDPETGWLQNTEISQRGRKKGAYVGTPDERDYLVLQLDGVRYYAHVVIWFYVKGIWPTHEIDHDDEDKSNNRWVNLRKANRSQNSCNRGALSNNKLGLKWVSAKRNKFMARVGTDNLGVFDTAQEAYVAASTYAKNKYGEFFHP